MAYKPDIQYITQFYSYGSEAKVLELKPAKAKKKTALPKAVPQQKICIQVDLVAWIAVILAVALVALMAVGVNNYVSARNAYEVMTDHVIELQNFNVQKQQEYVQMYDLADVEEKALALGMIPVEDAKVVFISPVLPEPQPEAPWWEDISWFLKGLFA